LFLDDDLLVAGLLNDGVVTHGALHVGVVKQAAEDEGVVLLALGLGLVLTDTGPVVRAFGLIVVVIVVHCLFLPLFLLLFLFLQLQLLLRPLGLLGLLHLGANVVEQLRRLGLSLLAQREQIPQIRRLRDIITTITTKQYIHGK
jgi:hypothetical protein